MWELQRVGACNLQTEALGVLAAKSHQVPVENVLAEHLGCSLFRWAGRVLGNE